MSDRCVPLRSRADGLYKLSSRPRYLGRVQMLPLQSAKWVHSPIGTKTRSDHLMHRTSRKGSKRSELQHSASSPKVSRIL